MEFYAVIILGFYAWGMINYTIDKKWTSAVATGINVLLWSPFVGRALGWW